MTTRKNAENLRKYKSRFSLTVEQIMAFPLRTNLIRKVKEFVSKFQTNSITMFYVTHNSHLDR